MTAADQQHELAAIADGTMTMTDLKRALSRGERWLLLVDDGAHSIVGIIDPLAGPEEQQAAAPSSNVLALARS
jgi:hypothetical protein